MGGARPPRAVGPAVPGDHGAARRAAVRDGAAADAGGLGAGVLHVQFGGGRGAAGRAGAEGAAAGGGGDGPVRGPAGRDSARGEAGRVGGGRVCGVCGGDGGLVV